MSRSEALRPLLFLDVDGVLNCPVAARFFDGREARTSHGIHVWLPGGVADRVHRLVEVFDPVWATCWREEAHQAFAPLLGIDGPEWPHLTFGFGANKLPAIIDLAAGRSWAWVDDDIDWELQRLEIDPLECLDGLLVQPDSSEGLTDEHVERLLAWAGGLVA